jgi:hypothetical protein
MRRLDLRGSFAPDGPRMAVCPHCWELNRHAQRLCGRCGADMHLVLQESGGLRRTAAVQSPGPVRASERLSPLQRMLVLGFVLLLFAAQVLAVIQAASWRALSATGQPADAAVPAGSGVP